MNEAHFVFLEVVVDMVELGNIAILRLANIGVVLSCWRLPC